MLRRPADLSRLASLLSAALVTGFVLVVMNAFWNVVAYGASPLVAVSMILRGYLVWMALQWIGGLTGRPTKLSVEQSGAQLLMWMTLIQVFGVLAVLSGLLVGLISFENPPMVANMIVAVLTGLIAIIGAYAARAWFRDPTSKQAQQRRGLLVGILALGAVLAILSSAFVVLSRLGNEVGWMDLSFLMSLVQGVFTVACLLLTARFVSLTMGHPQMDGGAEVLPVA